MANYTIERELNIITVSGDKGTYTHNYAEKSIRTKARRIFIAEVLRDYGTKAVEEVAILEKVFR